METFIYELIVPICELSVPITMSLLTPKENAALLTLFKDFSKDYNANSLSKKLEITPRGTLKILKNLKKQNLVINKQFGKAVFYKVNLNDYYTFRIIETALIHDSRSNAVRWLSEFQDLFKYVKIAIIFGSIIRNPKTANDLDLLLVFDEKNLKQVKEFIHNKNKILVKPIHPIFQSSNDFGRNLKNKNEVILSALVGGCVLCGYDGLIEVVKNVTNF